MKKWIVVIAFSLLFTMAAFGQDYPKFEVPVGFSFVNVHPDITNITSFNVFGGGGGFVYNVTPWIGIKADFEGYTQGSGLKNQLNGPGLCRAGERQRLHLHVRPPDQEAFRESCSPSERPCLERRTATCTARSTLRRLD